jgi:hypothetical protein
MRRAFALLLLFFAIDAVAGDKPLVPFDLVKTGVKLLQVRGVSVRGEARAVEFRNGTFRLRVQVTPHQTVVVDLNAGVTLRKIDTPNGVTEAIALSSSHYLLTIVDAPSGVELQFDDPSAVVLPERDGDLVVISLKFGSAAGRVIASGRISGQEWHDMKRVGGDVCVCR